MHECALVLYAHLWTQVNFGPQDAGHIWSVQQNYCHIYNMEPDDELVPKKRRGNETEISIIPISLSTGTNGTEGRSLRVKNRKMNCCEFRQGLTFGLVCLGVENCRGPI